MSLQICSKSAGIHAFTLDPKNVLGVIGAFLFIWVLDFLLGVLKKAL
jgi:hypothetical protein